MITETSILIGFTIFAVGTILIVLHAMYRTLKSIETDSKRWALEDEAYKKKNSK